MAGKKGRSGRPKSDSVVKTIKLTLDPMTDTDLIEFFDAVPRGRISHAVKAALRGGMDKGKAVAGSNESGAAANLLDDMLGAWALE